MDLFRYNSSRELDETDGRDGRTTFFSYNGGSTLSSLSFRNEYNSLGVQVNNGDTADFIQQDVFGTGNPGETNTLSQTGIQVMETLGWIPPSPGPVVSASNVTLSAGQTSVAASSLFIAADRNGDSITGYAVKDTGPGYFVLSGVTEANNQEIDVAATQLSQLIYQSAPGAVDQLQIRAENAQAWGSWVSFTVVAPPLLIQTDTNAYGSTSLAELGNNYFLYAAGTTAGPELRYAGAAVIAGGRSIPIGAVETASGYEVAWKLPSVNEYALWTVDSKGNFLSGSGALAGNSFKLESAETTFNQDLNGDGVIGLNPIVIQTDTNAYGSTSLAELGNNYFLYAAGTTAGPELRYAGAAVIAGGRSIPIGAVETASGYEVAWKLPSVNEYALWTVDSKGNFLSGSGALAGNSFKLESAETTFNQDLNGDGVIGLNPIVIQTDTNAYGSTSLAELGNNYFLYAAGTTAGPELRYAGAAVIAGGRSIPIGAVETASGYEVAWKLPSVNEYALWTVDSKGNFLSGSGALAGNSFKLESAETTFNQDLNGDGVIGLNPIVIQTDTNAYGSTSLAELGNNYFLYAAGTTAGPELRYAGAAVIAGGRSIPIGAVETASGYEVAWKLPSVNEYALWTVDSKGNFLSGSGALAGNSFKLESAETTFNQDLNGDGVIGLNPIVIQTDTNAYGSTSLAELGNNYFLYAAGTTAGPELRYAGAAVIAGGPIPIGAVETASGYEVAWKLPSVNEYALWTVDSKGNFLSGSGALAGNSFKLEVGRDHIQSGSQRRRGDRRHAHSTSRFAADF